MTADDRRLADPVEKACREWLVDRANRGEGGLTFAMSFDAFAKQYAAFVREHRLEAKCELLKTLEDDFRIHATEFHETRCYVDEGLSQGMADLMARISTALSAEREGKGVTE